MYRVGGLRIISLSAIAFVFPIAWLVGETMNVNAGGNQNSATPPAAAPQAEKPFDQAAALAGLRKSIAGKEQAPAETVFKNIQLLKGIPAGRVLRIMELGYARSLGVDCTHCHVPGAWEKEDKPTKQIARDMAAMVGAINGQHLKQIKNLKSETPVVNCTTCHRGQTKPAVNLPEAPK
jgi:hypothetical protein